MRRHSPARNGGKEWRRVARQHALYGGLRAGQADRWKLAELAALAGRG